MTEQERNELIDKFLLNELEGLELARFEYLIGSDKELKKSLQLELELRSALNEKSDFNLFKSLVNDAQKEYFEAKKPQTKQVWRAAAVFAVIATFGFLIWRSSVTKSPEYIFDNYFEPYEAPTNLRGTDITNIDEDFMLGLVRYDEQQYAQAIALFEKAYSKDSKNYTARFLMAVAYMGLKEFEQAEPIFLELISDSSHLFQDQARWYLGLLYLTDNDTSNDPAAKQVWTGLKDTALKAKAYQLK